MPSGDGATASGRQSRSSTFSSSVKRPTNSGNNTTSDVLSSGAGVLSMLKTSTEMGGLEYPMSSSRLPKPQRTVSNRRPNGGPPSRTSSHYSRSESIRSRGSNNSTKEPPLPGPWPYNNRQQFDNGHNVPPMHSNSRPSATTDGLRPTPTMTSDATERSFSLTNAPHMTNGLKDHRSLTSLRSQGPIPRPRSPFAYPTRFRRPAIRPSSPALSDNAGAARYRTNVVRPPHGPRGYTSPYVPSEGETVDMTYPQRAGFPPARSIETLRRPLAPNRGPQMTQSYETLPTNRIIRAESPISQHYRWRPNASPSPPLPSTNVVGWRGNAIVDASARSPLNTAPYAGFVQRVKTVLEERISYEDSSHRLHDNTTLVSSISEQTPPETANSLDPPVRKVTRDMIKAAVDPSSDSAPTPSAEEEGIKRLTREMIKAAVDDTSEINQDESTSAIDFAATDLDTKESAYEESMNGRNASMDFPRSTPTTANVQSKESQSSSPASTATSLASQSGEADYTMQFSMPKAVESSNTDATTPAGCDTNNVDVNPVTRCLLESKVLDRPSSLPRIMEDQQPSGYSDRLANAKSLPSLNRIVPSSLNTSMEANTQHPSVEVQRERSSDLTRDNKAAQLGDEPVHTKPEVVDTAYSTERPTPSQTLPDKSHQSHARDIELASCSTSSMHSFALRDSMLYQSDYSGRSTAHNSMVSFEPRLSAMRSFHFPLPDLTEDSQESASTTNLRMLGAKPPVFRSNHRRVSNDSTAQGRPSVPTPTPLSYLSRNLEDIRGIPSFNFSRVDLTAKLNSALGLRSSRSLEDIPSARTSDIETITNVDRPTSSNLVRGRYRSFFSDFNEFADVTAGLAEVAREAKQIEVMSELKNLSIPSVNALTLRLSELLPSIGIDDSRCDLLANEEIVKETIGETRDLGPERRPSAGLELATDAKNTAMKPPTKSPASVRKTGNSRDVRELCLMKELPPLPPGAIELDGNAGEPNSLPIAAAHLKAQSEDIAELEVATRKDPAETQDVHEIGATSPRKFKVKRPSEKSFRGSPQPWLRDENYPWESSAPLMSISLSQHQNSSQAYIPKFRLKKARSDADIPNDDTIRIARSMSPGPRFDASLVPRTDLFTEPAVGSVPKRSLMGSLSRRLGIKPKIDKAGFPIDPSFLHPEDRAFDPGDRYPTSGLTSPAGLNIDENRSYFSDDSSVSDHRPGFRKRFTKLKPKRSGNRATSPIESRSDINVAGHWPGNDGSVFEDPEDDTEQSKLQLLDEHVTAGMSKLEFRAKRVVERLRSLKYKCGQIIRGKNKGRKLPPSWYNHREESGIYSGV